MYTYNLYNSQKIGPQFEYIPKSPIQIYIVAIVRIFIVELI